jgi:hypothetical protein
VQKESEKSMKQSHLVLAVLVSATLVGCGGNSTPTVPPPVPTPTPVPTATPVPPIVDNYVCPLPALPDLHTNCPVLSPHLLRHVEDAVNFAILNYPDIFDMNNTAGPGKPYVKDKNRYFAAVVKNLHDNNVCAVAEKEEIGVKTTNDYNEQYNVLTSGSYVRNGDGIYITTCLPAQF